ncbi:Pullulanase secretion envelope PulD [Variovorax sp. PBS-H4]|uniref:type II and III secretion system protein family protein n=1 Tax=Variovorax sp. PBS-H4 TaxID=434008 RepID=UPI001316DB38|nr:type II and III secretion system protein family protein [Variovorax sp. PBS-H4]VTU26408.1 Pullulanase secretion envelope PulD [Variovorax sp. PBS-H4]
MHNNHRSLVLLGALALTGPSFAAGEPPAAPAVASAAAANPASAGGTKRCSSVVHDDRPTYVTLGKSTVIPLDVRVARVIVSGQPPTRAPAPSAATAAAPGQALAPAAARPAAASQPNANDGVADMEVMLLSPTDLFFRGKVAGSMNVILQNAQGTCFIKDIIVTIDSGALQAKLAELMPEENRIQVRGAERAIVLTGEISDALKLDDVMSLATSYGDGKKVVNLLRITSPQQVMLEVKIAEVSKTLLDKLGSSIAARRLTNGATNSYTLISNFLSGGGAFAEAIRVGKTAISIDGQKDDGLVRVLAEPNIMAISGQQASFLSGGKIFIPVSQTQSGGFPTITLEEKEFGIGVKFTPTVLNGGRVNLKMVSEVSDLSQTGSPFTTVSGVTSVLPSLTVRRADTTVQLNDGQSFVIAGLIKNNVTETIKRFPGLGEVPVVGALARSTEFQNDQTELLFVITPRLVKPLAKSPRLPTDNHVVPSRTEVYFNGALESATPPADAPPPLSQQ